MKLEYYHEHPAASRYNKITLSMFATDTNTAVGKGKGKGKGKRVAFPKLKGRAAEVVALMPALLWAWEQYSPSGDDKHNQVKTALSCSVHLDKVLHDYRDYDCLPPNVALTFCQAGFALNSIMNSLLTSYGDSVGWPFSM